jgi:hypothetical protein
MWEQDLVNLEQRSLIVDKKIKQIVPILGGKLRDFYPALGKLRQLEETLFKLLGLFRVFINLLELFLVEDLILQASLHDILPDFFDALDKQVLQLILLRSLIGSLMVYFLVPESLLLDHLLLVSDRVIVVSF